MTAPTSGSTQTCASCGSGFPTWSMFCTSCGAQTVDSRTGSNAPSAMAASAAASQTRTARAVRTTSNAHGTWAIVWVVVAYVTCFLFWFPAFSQAKKSRLRGEAMAGTATSITQVGLLIYILLQILGVALFIYLGGQAETGAGAPPPVGP